MEFRGKGELSLPQYFHREQEGWEWVEGGTSRPHGVLHITPIMTSVSRLLASAPARAPKSSLVGACAPSRDVAYDLKDSSCLELGLWSVPHRDHQPE